MRHLAILALDVEGVLVSNGVSQFPRSGLATFLDSCRALADDMVLFTSCNPVVVAGLQQTLVQEGAAPAWFADLAILYSPDGVKDLTRLGQPLDRVAIMDDQPTTPVEQRHRWIPVVKWESPYAADDALAKASVALRDFLVAVGD